MRRKVHMLKTIAIHFLMLSLLPGTLAAQDSNIGPGWKERILTAVGGALVGAGVGFFASQVAVSDWDEEGSRQRVSRSTWAVVGGGSGFMLGFSLPITGQAPGPRTPLPGSDRFIITGDQIREASLGNAMEAVRFFHPEWLRQQRPDSFADHTPDNIQVYLDNVRR